MRESSTFGQTLGLIFEVATGSPIFSAPTFAQIYLQTFTTASREGFTEPVHILTPVEHGPDAFDAHADRLIENIQRLKREARAKFERARQREP